MPRPLYQEIAAHGFTGSARTLRRYLARIRTKRARRIYRPVETPPGRQAQVDWGHFGTILHHGVVRHLYAFVLVLSWSRQRYVEFTVSQDMATFLACRARALAALGGVPAEIVYDNAKTVVKDRVGSVVQFDASASQGVTRLLDAECRRAGTPLISLFATPSLEGGMVVRYSGNGGCPNCLEWALYQGQILPPPGWDDDGELVQPPGCSERTFVGASYDLQELSLQAVRLVIETLSTKAAKDSLVQTLALINEVGQRYPPRWRFEALPKHPECCGRYS